MSYVRLFIILFVCAGASAAEYRSSRNIQSTVKEIEACIAEARADLDYYQSRVHTAEALVRRVKEQVNFQTLELERNRKLALKAAVTLEQVQLNERDLNQAVIDTEIAQSVVEERSAELRQSQARLTQAEEGNCVRIPPHP